MASLLLDIKAEVEAVQLEQITMLSERLTLCEERCDDLIDLCLVTDPPSADQPVKKRGCKIKKKSPAKQTLSRLRER